MLAFAVASRPPIGWSFGFGPLLVLVPITVGYLVRWRAVNAHPGRLALFLLGITLAVVALYSPIDGYGERLISMHMVQHLILLDLAPICCLLGTTKAIFRPVTKRVIQLEHSAPWLLSPKPG